MQFHEYVNLRNQMAKFGHNDQARSIGKSMKPDEFRSFYLERVAEEMKRARPGRESHELLHRCIALSGEQTWADHDRPFYNVWPIAEDLARNVKLDLPFSAIEIPFDSLVLRFARGHEPHNVTTAMIFWPRDWPNTSPNINVVCYFAGTMDRLTFRYDYEPDEDVENWLERLVSDSETSEWRSMGQAYRNANSNTAPLMVRLVVFIGLLANDRDMITPVVLAKDRTKYEGTSDQDAKEWIEKRAVRKLGRGFDVGKQLQAQKEASPHWRNPHLCLFWTGPGREKPVIRMRSGAVVQKVSMATVPTGYLGPERETEELEDQTYIYFAEAVGQDRIKIGKADNPEDRLKQLQTGSPVELRLLGVIADKASRETDIHALFDQDRIQGEWFNASPDLRRYIAEFADKNAG